MRSGGSRALELRELAPERFPKTLTAMRAALAEGVTPGIVAGLWLASDPNRIYVGACGVRRAYPTQLPSLPMQAETIFDLASLTKIMATATLAATLVDRRWIDWRTPLSAILPQAAPLHVNAGCLAATPVELGHLLSHTAGYVAWEPLWERMRDYFAGVPLPQVSVARRQIAMRELVLKIAPEVSPGERAVYSDISFLLLGFALEAVTGLRLDQAVQRFVWDPLGLETAFYRPVTAESGSARLEDVAATEESAWRGGVLQGQVHDDNCWAMGGYAGHAGAFGSVRDVLQFVRGIYPGIGTFLSRDTLRAAWSTVAVPAGCSRTLGWDTPSGAEPSAGHLFSSQSVGHLGYTGTSLWIDPEAGVAVTLLTNRVHPSRENNLIRGFRPRFHDAIRADL